MKRKIKIPKDLQAVMKESLDNHTKDLFSMALKNPEIIDENKVRQDCMFPFNDLGIDEMKKVFYDGLQEIGFDEKTISAIKYANDKTGRLCAPTKDKPIAISQNEWNEWQMLFRKAYDGKTEHKVDRNDT